YLKKTGSAEDAELAARRFPLRSSLVSLLSWMIGGIAIVLFSVHILKIPGVSGIYLFVACASAGLAASFVHFHILRSTLEPVRIEIARTLGESRRRSRFSILMKLVVSFTMLIALSLIFFTFLEDSEKRKAVEMEARHVLQLQLAHWSNLIA